MKKTVFSDWWQVFKFTFKQGTVSNKFRGLTIGVAVLLMAVGILINFGMAYSQKNDLDTSPIENVYLINNSDLKAVSTDVFSSQFEEKYANISFEERNESVSQVAESIKNEGEKDASDTELTKDVILEITQDEQAYTVKVLIPENSEISEYEAEELGEDFSIVVQQGKMLSLDVPIENQVMALSQVVINQMDAGEEVETEGEMLAKIYVPMLIVLIIFFITFIYGQSMGTVVSIEKSSKLVEYLLTITNSHCLILGKIMATAGIAIVQLLVWIIMLAGGFWLGDVLATEIVYSDYSNSVFEIMDLIRGQDGGSAFTIGSSVLTVVTTCISILFYCMFAGMVASFISKAEELQNVMNIYQVVMVLGYVGGYLSPLIGDESINTLMRVIPFTSAFMLPGDIIIGNVTLAMGILYTAIMFAFLVALVYITGKVYKSQLFNNGREGRVVSFVKKLVGAK